MQSNNQPFSPKESSKLVKVYYSSLIAKIGSWFDCKNTKNNDGQIRKLCDCLIKNKNHFFKRIDKSPTLSICATVAGVLFLLLWVILGKYDSQDNLTDIMLGVIQVLGSGGVAIIVYLYNRSKYKRKRRARYKMKLHDLENKANINSEAKVVVFVDAREEDKEMAQQIEESLAQEITCLRPVETKTSPTVFYRELTDRVKQCGAVILVYNTPAIPIDWVYERLRLYKRSLPVARRNNIAIFAKNETCQQLLEGKKKSFPIIPPSDFAY